MAYIFGGKWNTKSIMSQIPKQFIMHYHYTTHRNWCTYRNTRLLITLSLSEHSRFMLPLFKPLTDRRLFFCLHIKLISAIHLISNCSPFRSLYMYTFFIVKIFCYFFLHILCLFRIEFHEVEENLFSVLSYIFRTHFL